MAGSIWNPRLLLGRSCFLRLRAHRACWTSLDHDALRFQSAAHSIPLPSKGDEGEDSFFISSSIGVGVADGVGGWKLKGISPKKYADDIMQFSRESVKKLYNLSSTDQATLPVVAIRSAYDRKNSMKEEGSTTVCVVTIKDNVIYSANLGDSGFMVVREGKVVYETGAQQHGFNYPFQLMYSEQVRQMDNSDIPEMAISMSLKAEKGDVVILATDGLWDNVRTEEILSVLEKLDCIQPPLTPRALDGVMDCVFAEVLESAEEGDKGSLFGIFSSIQSSVEELRIMRATRAAEVEDHGPPPDLDPSLTRAGVIARVLALYAQRRYTFTSDLVLTPFEIQAEREGITHYGGKPDDVTVVVSIVE